MTVPQLEQRINEIDRADRIDQRRARRDRALRDRGARRSGLMVPPPSPVRPPTAIDERMLITGELDRRRRPTRIAFVIDPPGYLTSELGPVPDELLARRRWRAAAEQIEMLRDRLGHTDQKRGLPEEIGDPELRVT